GELIIYKPDKVMLGGMTGKTEDDNSLNVHHLQLQKKDTIYLCSDGFQDQFGGPQDKKFMAKRLRELFTEVSELPMKDQKEIITQRFQEWKKDTDQTDDVMMLGFRI
ncbi:MAG: SpoIIE family protein phosphatase, partial [Cyclobacteriaceae bacterium]